MLTAIWAEDENGLIGKANHLPWRLPNDLQHFKRLTESNVIVMGRKTYEGLGKRPLPNRTTIVMTREEAFDPEHEDVLVMHSVDEVRAFAEESSEEVFIVGGSSIYHAFESFLDKCVRTIVLGKFEGDAYFPVWDWTQFELIEEVEGLTDEKNLYPHIFLTYQRKGR
jgi:dihydrofolate reductase